MEERTANGMAQMMSVDSMGGSETAPRLAILVSFVCTAASIGFTLLMVPNAALREHWTASLVVVSTVLLVCALILVFLRPRFGFGLGLIAGLLTLPWYIWTELTLAPGVSSWIILNSAGEELQLDATTVTFAKLKILSVAMIVIAIVCSSFRLLPRRFFLRHQPLYQRTWPALVATLLVLAVWFARSAMPYRTAIISDGITPEFRILHVDKRGLRFHETEIDGFRDATVYVRRNDRRLFQYRFETRLAHSVMSQTLHDRARELVESPDLSNLQTGPPKALWSWNAEGWYVVLNHLRSAAFTSEYETVPPRQITDLFYEILKLPATEDRPLDIRDVCMGFCYGPVAALHAPSY